MNLRLLRLTLAAAAAPMLVAVTVLAAWNTPGYSGWRHTVSHLASPGQPWAATVRASFVVYGVLVVIGASVIAAHAGPGRRPLTWALRTFGAAAVVAGLAPKHQPSEPHTAASTIHVAATLLGGGALVAAMAIVAFSSSVDRPSAVRSTSLMAGVTIILGAYAFRASWGTWYYGALERMVLAPGLAWIAALAWWSARAEARP